MKPADHPEWELRRTLPATLQAIEALILEIRPHLRERLPSDDWFSAELLMREALTNAVVHGCRADPRKLVKFTFRLKGRRLTISVCDPGKGFNRNAVGSRDPDLARSSGRGIEIIRKYGIRVRFNTKGNAVTIVKQCR